MKDSNLSFLSYFIFRHNLLEVQRTFFFFFFFFFIRVPDSFSEVDFFQALEIVVNRLNAFFIEPKFLFSQKSFEVREVIQIQRSQIRWIGWMQKQIKAINFYWATRLEWTGAFPAKNSVWISDEFRTNISALVWNLSVICLESALFHPILIRANILGPKSFPYLFGSCPKSRTRYYFWWSWIWN